MRTYVIGRSRYADIVLADSSVAARHAELTVAEDGRCFLICADAAGGTWRRPNDGESWSKLRQEFIDRDEGVAFGRHVTTMREVLALIAAATQDGGGRWKAEAEEDPRTGLPRGRVERDPLTGEIVRKGV